MFVSRFTPLPKPTKHPETQTFPVRIDGKKVDRPVSRDHALAIVDGKHLQVVRREKLT